MYLTYFVGNSGNLGKRMFRYKMLVISLLIAGSIGVHIIAWLYVAYGLSTAMADELDLNWQECQVSEAKSFAVEASSVRGTDPETFT